MIDHLGIQVRDPHASAEFYDAVLAPLGGRRMKTFGDVFGFGVSEPTFWLSPAVGDGEPWETHVAFQAPDRAAVVAFHDAAVAVGAEVLHAPRVFPEYHPSYFGAFVRDLDGNNVEAVCHRPE